MAAMRPENSRAQLNKQVFTNAIFALKYPIFAPFF